MSTSYTDATVCPKCGLTGNVRIKGKTLHTVYCENKDCKWYDTAWNITINEDGSVPDPQDFSKKPKTFLVSKKEAEDMQRLTEEYLTSLAQSTEVNSIGKPIRNVRG